MTLRKGECRLADIRGKRNWTQEDVSDALKERFDITASVQTISKYENNIRDIPDVTRRALALIFKCKMDDFYDYPND